MDFDIRLPGSDPTERRRLQNRLAQRKFRLKKAGNLVGQVSRPVPTFAPPCQIASPQDPAGSDLAIPLTTSVLSPHEQTGHSGLTPNNADPGELTTMDGSRSAAGVSMLLPGISPPAVQPLDFGSSPSSSSLMNRSALLRINSDISLPTATVRPPSTQQQHQECMQQQVRSEQSSVHSNVSPASDALRPVVMPPPRDQVLYESRPDASLRILSTSSPADAVDGWLGTLHIAAQKGNDSIVRLLLEQGTFDCNEKDSDGRTPLMYAAMEGHEAIVRLLLAQGARVGEVDRDRRSALHLAVLHKRESVLRILLAHGEQGLSIDAYDVAGWTPLHIAAHRDFEAGMVLLLQSGANLHSKARKCPFTGTVTP